jgi:hypothetical protein
MTDVTNRPSSDQTDYRYVSVWWSDNEEEMKGLAEDEFSHWNTMAFPTERKQKRFQLVKTGQLAPPLFATLPSEFIEALETEPPGR